MFEFHPGSYISTKSTPYTETFQVCITLDLVNKPIAKSKTPIELLTRLANQVVNRIGVDPNTLPSHIFDPGILREGNNRTEYRLVADALRIHAPKLWNYYQSLTLEQKKELGIMNLEELTK